MYTLPPCLQGQVHYNYNLPGSCGTVLCVIGVGTLVGGEGKVCVVGVDV